MTAFSSAQIKELMKKEPPVVSGYIDLEAQLQPSGFDLTLREVNAFSSAGKITCDNASRRISELGAMEFDSGNQLYLAPGAYLLTYNEIVSLPLNLMALALPRSSLLRSGVTVNTAVWDPGYTGRAQSMLTVLNPSGFSVERNARVVQLVFLLVEGQTDGYRGAYQRENMD